MIQRPIQTEQSFLTVQQFPLQNLVRQCIIEVNNKLIKNPEIVIYGKTCIQHRSIGFFSNDSIGYHYSGQLAESQQLEPNLTLLLKEVNKMYNADFNGILVNRYENGGDSIGAHSDDESSLSNIGVVAISYGATRKFRIRDKKTKTQISDIQMKSFDMIHMGGKFQQEFTHEIPVEKTVKDVRYSFTFRKHLK